MTTDASPICKATSLDHIVLTVSDLDRTVKLYTETLGMEHQTFRSPTDIFNLRQSLRFGDQKINLHQAGKEFEPKARNVQTGSGDLCFLIDRNVDDVLKQLQDKALQMLEGGKIVERTGAKGTLRSIYLRDPDGNLVELSNYA